MGKNKGGARVRVKQQHAPVNPLAGLSIPPEEMINFAPKPDSNITYPWPLLEMNMDHSRFHAIYPNYLDANKTIALGRRIAASDAVDTPTVDDVAEVLRALRIRHAVQPFKGYPRDEESRWDNSGRVLVDLRGERVPNLMPGTTLETDDLLADDDAAAAVTRNKVALLREIAKRIPALESRKKRITAEAKKKEEEEKKREKELAMAKSKSAAGGSGSGGTSSKKKKGKKKR